jgi:glycosyltransferase involved in cell wall biosynthesis
MSYGLPIVTTPIRGAADLLVEGENALFVPPRDPEALAGALLRLLRDERLWDRISIANREKVKEFTPESVVPRYVEIMKSLVDEG